MSRTLSLFHPDAPETLIAATVVRTTKRALIARTVEISRRSYTNDTFGPGALHATVESYLAAVSL